MKKDTAVHDLGVATDIEIVDRLLMVRGQTLVDAGCGPGDLARALAARGARVLAIEPDEAQAAKNAAAPPIDGITFINAGAESIPAPPRSVDGVLFSKSLHHVPAELIDAALRRAESVIKPDGFVFVLEPDMSGSYFELLRPFHDETGVRTLARAALARTADVLFAESATYRYRNYALFKNFATFRNRYVGATYLSVDLNKVDSDLVRALFEAGQTDGGYRFEQRMWLRFYRTPRA